MDSNSWTRISTSARRYLSRSDVCYGGEDFDVDEESRQEYRCPFCPEEFDVVGLCCHIDEEHPVEAKNGVCPVCGKRLGINLVGHITGQHGNFVKVQRKRRFRKGVSNSTLSILKKELREGNLHSFLGGSPCLVSSISNDPDPLLSSFMYNTPVADEPINVQPCLTDEHMVVESSKEDLPERIIHQSPLSEKDQEEKARKCEFVQGLVLSTFLEDGL